MKTFRVFGIVALCVTTGAAHAQLTAPGGAQPGMQADGEGQSAVPFLRAVRPADADRASSRPDAAGRDTGRTMGRSTAPGATTADRDVPAGMAGSGGMRGAPAGGIGGDDAAYPR